MPVFETDSRDFFALGAAEEPGTLPSEATAKQQMATIINDQPDDSSYDEVLRELAFYRMIQRGLADAAAERTTSDNEVRRRLRDW